MFAGDTLIGAFAQYACEFSIKSSGAKADMPTMALTACGITVTKATLPTDLRTELFIRRQVCPLFQMRIKAFSFKIGT